MKKRLKKLIGASLAFLLLCPYTNGFAAEIGDKIEDVLSTDIVTYIEGIRVPSFNISGRTAIIVENLNAKNLPFAVSYNDFSRTLSIEDGKKATRDFFHFERTNPSAPIGAPIMDVLYTDIETFYAGKKLESFNIGGFTCVYATDFANLYGNYTWEEKSRCVKIFRQKDELKGEVSAEDVARKLPADVSTIEKADIFDRWGSPVKSHLLKGNDGNFYTLEVSNNINIEKYDADLNHESSFTVKKELPIFGAFLEGEEYNYIAFGQENLKDSNSLYIIKIAVYDKKFNKLNEIALKECQTAIPFDASNVSLAENEDYLVLHTARSQYKEADGYRPQTQLTAIINKKDWSLANTIEKFQPNHTSHALKGYAKIHNDKIITANYSDTNPVRGAFIQELDFNGNLLATHSMFKVGGPPGANCTGAMLGGFEISDSSYILALNSIDHSLPTDYYDTKISGIDQEERDVYVVTSDEDGKSITTQCLTYYSEEGKTASVPYIVKLESGNFMVLWQKFENSDNTSNTLCYAFLDSDGKLVGFPLQAEGHLSESCQPIEIDGKVIWYVNTTSGRTFYHIDSALPDESIFDELNPPENSPEENIPEENIPEQIPPETTTPDGL